MSSTDYKFRGQDGSPAVLVPSSTELTKVIQLHDGRMFLDGGDLSTDDAVSPEAAEAAAAVG